MNNNFSNKVIVISTNHHNGLGIIRSIGESGREALLIVLSNKKSFITKSKYITKYWYANNDLEVIKILNEEIADRRNKNIIIPADDISTSIIDKNISLIKDNFIVPNIGLKDNAITNRMNKLEMNEIARNYGLSVPKSQTISFNNNFTIKEFLKKLNMEYPLIIKPAQSIDGSKSDILIVKDSKELRESLNNLQKRYDEILVQEYIKKEGELGIEGIVTYKDKEVIIPGIIEKTRQSVISPGSTTYAKLVNKNALIDLNKIKDFIKHLEYVGIFDMEFIYTKNKVYFIELNFRNGAYGYAYTRAGINLPLLWCLNAINEDTSKLTKKNVEEITLMNEVADFRNIFSGNISIFKWIIEFVKTDAYLILNKKDFKPFIYKFLYR